MAEPLGSTTSSPDTAAPLDPGLQEAAQGLADQIDGQAPDAAPESAAATPSPQAAPPAAPAREPVRFGEGLKKFQGGFRGRIQREREEARRLRGVETRYTQSQQETARLLQAAIEALRAKGGGGTAEEPIPEAVLNDPVEFQKWVLSQQGKNVNEALKPVMEAIQRQEERFEQLEKAREQQAEEAERHQAATQQFLTWEREYQQEAPELAAGVRERYTTGRDLLARALQAAGVEQEMARPLAERHLFAIASSADATGDNGVAAIDGFIYGLYAEAWDMVRQDLAQDGIQIPAFDGSGAAPQAPAPAPQAAAPVLPQQSEAERLQAVRARTATTGNAAPRVAERGVGAAPSQALQLYRGGIRDPKALRAAALAEANGVSTVADRIMAELIDQMA